MIDVFVRGKGAGAVGEGCNKFLINAVLNLIEF